MHLKLEGRSARGIVSAEADSSQTNVRGAEQASGDRFTLAHLDGAPLANVASSVAASVAPPVAPASSALAMLGHPTLKAALESTKVEAIAPEAAYPVPEDILDALDHAHRVLVIGHALPDWDCVGSSTGLARALRALGKEADACVDDALPRNQRGDPNDNPKRASELTGPYDLVVVVDVAQANRIAGAARMVALAKRVVVIDHHQADPKTELGVAPGTDLRTWVRPDANAAALLVASTARTLMSRHPERIISAPERTNIFLPLARGTYTDTDGFERTGSSLTSLGIFKFLVHDALEGSLDQVTRSLDSQVPRAGTAVLFGKKGLPPSLRRRDAEHIRRQMSALARRGVRTKRELIGDRLGTILTVPKAVSETALAAARLDDPNANTNDLHGEALHDLDRQVRRHQVAVLLWEDGDRIQVSTRSKQDGAARALAKHLAQVFGGTGGGHGVMAGAEVKAPLEQVAREVRAWLLAQPSAPPHR